MCIRCNGEMKIISFIDQDFLMHKILNHLGLWSEKPSRAPPDQYLRLDEHLYDYSVVREPFDDGRPGYDEPCISII